MADNGAGDDINHNEQAIRDCHSLKGLTDVSHIIDCTASQEL
jgi:hypothetical protein